MLFHCIIICTAKKWRVWRRNWTTSMHICWILHLFFKSINFCLVKCYQFWIVFQFPVSFYSHSIIWIFTEFGLLVNLSATMKKRMPAKKRLWVYAVYAFGLSAAMSALCPIIDSIDKIPDEFKPNIGEGRCFLKRMIIFLHCNFIF